MKILRKKMFSTSYERQIKWREMKKGASNGFKAGLALSIIPAAMGGVIGSDHGVGKIVAGTALAAGSILGSSLGAVSGYNRGKWIIQQERLLEKQPEKKKNIEYVKKLYNSLKELDNFYVWLQKKDPSLFKQSMVFNDIQYPCIDDPGSGGGELNNTTGLIEICEFYIAIGDEVDTDSQRTFSYDLKKDKIVDNNNFNYYSTKSTKNKDIKISDLKKELTTLIKKSAKQTPEKEYIQFLKDCDVEKKEIEETIKLRRLLEKRVIQYTDYLISNINRL